MPWWRASIRSDQALDFNGIPLSDEKKSSYQQILKSSALIGGSSIINILLNIVRTKVLAVLIGTEGTGLFGTFNSVTTLIGGIAGMGVSTSGVRQIAVAVGTNDQQQVARTALVLRRTSLVLGLLGMLFFLGLCRPISIMTFGNATYAGALALLSVTTLFAEIAAGQSALIQGLRRIKDLAALSIWGSVLGTIFSIPIIFIYRESGIVPFLVTVSAFTIATSSWYARKVEIPKIPVPWSTVWSEAKILLHMGVVFMASGLMTSAVAYLTRVLIIREFNLEAAGLYQSAFTLASVYVGFVLSAMGADYYPRLTAVAEDNQEVNRLVNEQSEAALLMALPGILGTLTFAPWVISLLYSAEFAPAVDILRWQILGILGRIITWPLGFMLLAKGRAKTFFFAELATNFVHLGLVWFGMKYFGLAGLGMAFLGLYLFYAVLIFILVHGLSGFFWTKDNLRLVGCALLVTTVVFLVTAGKLPSSLGLAVGSITTLGAGVFAIRKMAQRAGYADLRAAWKGIQARIKSK